MVVVGVVWWWWEAWVRMQSTLLSSPLGPLSRRDVRIAPRVDESVGPATNPRGCPVNLARGDVEFGTCAHGQTQVTIEWCRGLMDPSSPPTPRYFLVWPTSGSRHKVPPRGSCCQTQKGQRAADGEGQEAQRNGAP